VCEEPGETAQFDPGITDAELSDMELQTVGDENNLPRGTLIQDRCHKRTFYRDMGRVIGASAGERTQFIFVEYVNSGTVHGRPMTWREIQEKVRRAR
jgi:hypothetical protein